MNVLKTTIGKKLGTHIFFYQGNLIFTPCGRTYSRNDKKIEIVFEKITCPVCVEIVKLCRHFSDSDLNPKEY